MYAVRFGSYSIAATRAGTPSFWRLKSILRYRRFAPPPRWREVMRPCVLRPPDFLSPSVSAFSGSFLVTSARSLQVAKRRPGDVGLWRFTAMRFSGWTEDRGQRTGPCSVHCALCAVHSFAYLLAFEQFDVIVRMQLHHGLLPRAAAPRGVAAPLRLRLHAHRAHLEHAHAEDLLDRLADLGLVRAVVHAERVLVGREQRVALLGHDRADDHGACVHAVAASRSGLRA